MRLRKEYAEKFFVELAHKPKDCELLDRFAAMTAGKGRVCDLGCGPGQIARYLHERGVEVCGIDLAPGMVEVARRLNPAISFEVGDMRAVPLANESLAGLAAFYSIIHIPRPDVTEVLGELRRVLQPGGMLLLAFHGGSEVVHLDEWWGKPVALDFTFSDGRKWKDIYGRQDCLSWKQSSVNRMSKLNIPANACISFLPKGRLNVTD